MNWLIADSYEIVDFGCGSGVLSLLCALRGKTYVTGMDLSDERIRIAKQCTGNFGNCWFIQGSTEELEKTESCIDGIVLSNILDNLRPMDAGSAQHASIRILKPGGKALIKLNPWLSPGKIKEWNIRTIEMDLRGDGSCIEIKKIFLSGTAASDIFCCPICGFIL